MKLIDYFQFNIPENAVGPFTVTFPGGKQITVATREELNSMDADTQHWPDEIDELKISVKYEIPTDYP